MFPNKKLRLVILSFLLAAILISSCRSPEPAPEVLQSSPTAEAAPPDPTAAKEPSPVPTQTLPPPTPTPGIPTAYAFGETQVLNFEDHLSLENFKVSPDGRRFAYTIKAGDQMQIVLDGEASQAYDQISTLIFSPDSQHLAFIVTEEDGQYLVVDGTAQPKYEDISVFGVFSPDSQRLAYMARQDRKPIFIVDGEEYPYLGSGEKLIFSPDSRHFAFIAGNLNDEWFVVLDGDESVKFDDIRGDDLQFSPDSQRLTFQGRRAGDWFVVVDGEVSEPMDNFASEIVFSPDSRHVAYSAERNGFMPMNLDGVPLETYKRSFDPVFSPDSQHLAYKATWGGDWFVVLDGEEQEVFHGWPVKIDFSPDSQTLVYVDENDKKVLVINGEAGEPHHNISPVVFSPDSRRMAYRIHNGDNWVVVLDGEEVAVLEFSHYNLEFSPDSRHLVYTADLDDGEAVYVDGDPGKVYEEIISREVYFDTEGNIFYYTTQEDGIYLVREQVD